MIVIVVVEENSTGTQMFTKQPKQLAVCVCVHCRRTRLLSRFGVAVEETVAITRLLRFLIQLSLAPKKTNRFSSLYHGTGPSSSK